MVWSGAEGTANPYPCWWASGGSYREKAPPELPEHYKTHYKEEYKPRYQPPPDWRPSWGVCSEDRGVSGNHDTLGLKRSASQEEIRAAYLHKAKQTHPDKGGDPKEFIKIKEAYDCLVQ